MAYYPTPHHGYYPTPHHLPQYITQIHHHLPYPNTAGRNLSKPKGSGCSSVKRSGRSVWICHKTECLAGSMSDHRATTERALNKNVLKHSLSRSKVVIYWNKSMAKIEHQKNGIVAMKINGHDLRQWWRWWFCSEFKGHDLLMVMLRLKWWASMMIKLRLRMRNSEEQWRRKMGFYVSFVFLFYNFFFLFLSPFPLYILLGVLFTFSIFLFLFSFPLFLLLFGFSF